MASATAPARNNTVYVRNLDERVKITDLTESLSEIFSEYGTIIDIVAKSSLKRKGQAFIVFENEESAESAIEEIQGFELYEKPMQLAFARTTSDATLKRIHGEDSEAVQQHKKHRTAEKERKQAQELQDAKLRRPVPSSQPATSKLAKPSAGATGIVPDEYLPPNKTLFAQNLPENPDVEALTQLFQRFSGFKEIRLVPGRKGLAFVEYEDEAGAISARESMNNAEFEGSHIKVTYQRQ